MALWVMRSCSLVDLSACLPELTGQEVIILYQVIMSNAFLFTCRPFNLSTCLLGLTGQKVNILYQGFMGNAFLLTCRSVNLSTRVDRSVGQHIISEHYSLAVLVDLSTCLSGLTGRDVNIGVQGIMYKPFLFPCRPVNPVYSLVSNGLRYHNVLAIAILCQEANIGVQGIMGISYLSICRPVKLSTLSTAWCLMVRGTITSWRLPYCPRYYPLTFMLTCQLSSSVIIKAIF